MARLTDEQWEALKAEWRTGAYSNRELADKYGVSETAIRKKAKFWVRDLGDAVEARAARKLLGDIPNPEGDQVGSRLEPRANPDAPKFADMVRNPTGLIEEVILEQMADRRATENLAVLNRADDLKRVRNRVLFLLEEVLSNEPERMQAVSPVLLMGTGTNIPALLRSLAATDESLQKVVRTALGMDRDVKTKVQVTGEGGGPIQTQGTMAIDVTKLSTEQLAALAAVNRALDGEEARKGPPMPPGEPT